MALVCRRNGDVAGCCCLEEQRTCGVWTKEKKLNTLEGNKDDTSHCLVERWWVRRCCLEEKTAEAFALC